MQQTTRSAEYEVEPIAEPWGDSGWRAGVVLGADDARGHQGAKSLGDRVFDSREEALSFARSEYGALGSAPEDDPR